MALKTYKEILDKIYNSPEINAGETSFDLYTLPQKLSVEMALTEIWDSANFSFRETSMSFNTISGTSQYDLPPGRIKNNGLKVASSARALRNKSFENANDLASQSGTPYFFWVADNKINLYPTPNAIVAVSVGFYTNNKAKTSGGTAKSTLELSTDTLNMPEEMEQAFLLPLIYKTLMININDPTDEIYIHSEKNYPIALNYLKTQSVRVADASEFVIQKS